MMRPGPGSALRALIFVKRFPDPADWPITAGFFRSMYDAEHLWEGRQCTLEMLGEFPADPELNAALAFLDLTVSADAP